MKRTLLTLLLIATTALGTVTTLYEPEYFDCNGSVTDFVFEFRVEQTTDVDVYLRIIATGAETKLTLNSDYSLSATNNDYSGGGTVTTVSTYSSAYQIIIGRSTELTQEAQFVNNKALENTLDRSVMSMQEVQDNVSRAIRAPIGDESPDMELPNSTVRAGKYAAYDSDGNPTVTNGTTSDIIVSSYMETLIDDATAADARTTLGVGTTDTITIAGLITTDITTTDFITKGPWVDVRAFGAVGDGVTDDTAAIQAAIDSVGGLNAGGLVFLPAGTYKISSTIDLKNRVWLEGTGWGSILSYTGSGVAVRLTVATIDSWYSRIHGIKIIDAGTGTHGLQIHGVHSVDIDYVWISGFSTAGIHLTGGANDENAVNIHILSCLINANGDGILADNNRANAIGIYRTNISSNTGWGINANSDIRSAIHTGWVISNCVFATNTTGGLFFENVAGLDFAGNYCETHSQTIRFGTAAAGNSMGITIHGNHFNGTNIGIWLEQVDGIEIYGNIVGGFTSGAQAAFIYIPDLTTVTKYRIANNTPFSGYTNHVKVATNGFGNINTFNFLETTSTLADSATPHVGPSSSIWLTGGTQTITAFAGTTTGSIYRILAEHTITITDGTNIFLSGSANFTMAAGDTLTLIGKTDGKLYELSRGDN